MQERNCEEKKKAVEQFVLIRLLTECSFQHIPETLQKHLLKQGLCEWCNLARMLRACGSASKGVGVPEKHHSGHALVPLHQQQVPDTQILLHRKPTGEDFCIQSFRQDCCVGILSTQGDKTCYLTSISIFHLDATFSPSTLKVGVRIFVCLAVSAPGLVNPLAHHC